MASRLLIQLLMLTSKHTNWGNCDSLRRSLVSSSSLRAPSSEISSWSCLLLNLGRGYRSPAWKSSWQSLETTSYNGRYNDMSYCHLPANAMARHRQTKVHLKIIWRCIPQSKRLYHGSGMSVNSADADSDPMMVVLRLRLNRKDLRNSEAIHVMTS